jgi:hypothetical protein
VLAALLVGAGLVSSAAAGLRALLIAPQAQSVVANGITREHLVNGLVFLAFMAMALALVVSGVQRNEVLKKIVGRTNDKLLHFATHDVLTGLPNRALPVRPHPACGGSGTPQWQTVRGAVHGPRWFQGHQ